jgi:hypothetical protein
VLCDSSVIENFFEFAKIQENGIWRHLVINLDRNNVVNFKNKVPKQKPKEEKSPRSENINEQDSSKKTTSDSTEDKK